MSEDNLKNQNSNHIIDDFSAEFKAYMELNSFLLLPQIDAQDALEEIKAHKEEFVIHRKGSQEGDGRWKSIGLRTYKGDHRLTQFHEEYGPEAQPDYRETQIAQQCPKLMELLHRITDISQCERIRVMLLEPGAKIKAHNDNSKPAAITLNFMLNYPKGCEFTIDLNKENQADEYTKTIPLKSNTPFLLNVSNQHEVINNSEEDRYMIIVHGPLKFPSNAFKKIISEKENLLKRPLHDELLYKLLYRGIDVRNQRKHFFKAWSEKGVDKNSIPHNFKMYIVEDDDWSKELRRSNTELITKASLYPLEAEVIQTSDLDNTMEKIAGSYDVAIFIASGNYILKDTHFIYHTIQHGISVLIDHLFVRGHIIAHPQKVPYLHEQFLIVNLNSWKDLGSPSMNAQKGTSIRFGPYHYHDEHIHDNYTPLSLAQGDNYIEGTANFGSFALNKAVQNKVKSRNIFIPLRRTKTYAYPNSHDHDSSKINQVIEGRIDRYKKVPFYFNTAPLYEKKVSVSPQNILSVCAGINPAYIFYRFKKDVQNFTFFDWSQKSIDYWKYLLTIPTSKNLSTYIIDQKWKFQEEHNFSKDELSTYVYNSLKSTMDKSFNGQYELFKETLEAMAQLNPKFYKIDLLEQPDVLINQISSESQTFIWHSNIWVNNVSLLKYTQNELKKNYISFIENICHKINAKPTYHTVFNRSILHKNNKPIVDLSE